MKAFGSSISRAALLIASSGLTALGFGHHINHTRPNFKKKSRRQRLTMSDESKLMQANHYLTVKKAARLLKRVP